MWTAQEGHEAGVEREMMWMSMRMTKLKWQQLTDIGIPAGSQINAVVKLLLSRYDHVDVNARSNAGNTPLILAARKGHEALVKLLLSRDDACQCK